MAWLGFSLAWLGSLGFGFISLSVEKWRKTPAGRKIYLGKIGVENIDGEKTGGRKI